MPQIFTKIPNAKAGIDYKQSVGRQRWVIGLDLAQSADWTAAVCIEVWSEPAPTWGRGYIQEMYPPRHRVVQALRLVRGLEYTAIVKMVGAMMQDTSFRNDVSLVVDVSGVGAAVASIMREKGISFTGVHITSGEQLREIEHRHYRCGKSFLVTSLAAAIESGKFQPTFTTQRLSETSY